jgi:hypothetical protein
MTAAAAREFGQRLAGLLGVPFDRLEAAVAASREPEAIEAALGVAPGSVHTATQTMLAVARAWHASSGQEGSR